MNDIVEKMLVFNSKKVKEGDLLLARDKDGKPYKGLVVHVSYNYLEFVYVEEGASAEQNRNEERISIFAEELETNEKEGWKIQVIRPEWTI